MKRSLILSMLLAAACADAASLPPYDSTAVPAPGMEIIRGTYSYTYGDKESLVDGRQTCKELAVRDAVESYYLFLESASTVENSVLKQDIVRSVAAGSVRNLRVIDQKEEGRTLTCTVEGEVDPDEVRNRIAACAASDSSRSAAAAPEAAAGTAPATDFAILLSKYENRIDSADRESGGGRGAERLDRLQEMDALLNERSGRVSDPFESAMIRSMLLRNRLLLAVARSGNDSGIRNGSRRPLVRAEIRRAGEELERSLDVLARLTGLTEKQAAVRKAWTLRCRGQMARIRSAIR
jgi:hypothetical protein